MTESVEGKAETRALMQAIGAFVISFSEMIDAMQSGIATMLEDPGKGSIVIPPERNKLFDLLFETLTAAPIGLAFFAMCAQAGDLNDSDMEILRTLRRLVDDHVKIRNQVMHATWSVGWVVHETGIPVPPSAHKIRTAKWQTENESLGFASPKGILQYAGQMAYLASMLRVFGGVCRERQCGTTSDRPSSVLAIHSEGKKSQRLVRHIADKMPHVIHLVV